MKHLSEDIEDQEKDRTKKFNSIMGEIRDTLEDNNEEMTEEIKKLAGQYAEFEKEQEEALKTINVGDTITFEGECLSAGTWVECELLQ